MKKFLLHVLFIFIFSIVNFPSLVHAAGTTTDNFDSYSTGMTINGENGGSGWVSGWVASSGLFTTDVAPSGGQGGLALHNIGGSGGVSRTRAFPGSFGTIHFKVRISNNLYSGVLFTDSGTGGVNNNRFGINLNNHPGKITATNGQNYDVDLADIVSNTWHDIDIKFGHVPGKFAISIDGGTYSADFNMGNGDISSIDGIVLFTDVGETDFWIDDLKITNTQVPTTTYFSGSGTTNRLAKYTSSTTIGDSLFLDDGTNTILTSGNLFVQPNSIFDVLTSGVINFGTDVATSLFFGRSGQNMIINSNVGIGTTTPIHALDVNGTTRTTNIITGSLSTSSTCNSTTSPAVCTSASAGSIAMPTTGVIQVNTTAIGPNSQILITEDSSLSSRLGITCNSSGSRTYTVSARTPGVSFTIKSGSNISGNVKPCLNYWIVN